MKHDEREKLATAVWQGDTPAIAALQDMTAADLHEVEKAIADRYQAAIILNGPPERIHAAVAKARANWRAKAPSLQEGAGLDQALREANAED